MKITIYELLGMIKDGKAPKKIKYRQNIFGFIHSLADYKPDDIAKYHGNYLLHYLFEEEVNFLNDYVEIIEEPKKIEKIPLPSFDEFKSMSVEERYVITAKEYDLLNELIDEINNLKEK